MKKTSGLALLLAVVLVAWALAGCGGAASSAVSTAPSAATSGVVSAPAAGGIQLTDMLDRQVTLTNPAKKIVATAPADVEILYAIGAGNTLVGRGEYCNYPEEALAVPAVASGGETNVEQIIALAPDVVLMNTTGLDDERIKTLEAAGIQVVITHEEDIAGAYENIRLIGAVTGKNTEAEAEVAKMETVFADIAAKSKEAGNGEAKTIYFEVSPLEYGLWTAGGGTFMDEIAAMLGLVNIFADVEGWAEISEEQVVERNPDYIVTITMYYGDGPTPEEEIQGRAGWQDIAAIRNQEVLAVDSDMIARPGPRLAVAAQQLYDFIYGAAA